MLLMFVVVCYVIKLENLVKKVGKLGEKSGKLVKKKWENLVKKRGKLGQKIFFITHYSPYKNTRDPIGSNISNFGQKLIVFKISFYTK